MSDELQGKRVLVIGGSRGIGEAAARVAGEAGCRLLIAGRNEARLSAAAARLGGEVPAFPVDVTDEGQLEGLFEKAGPIDHLVVTAASAVLGPLSDQETEGLRGLLESKVIGQFLAVKYGAPRVREGGSITLCSGIVSRKPLPGAGAYAAAGAAIEAAARVWALEYAPLRINVVVPGIIDTPVWNDLMPEEAKQSHFGGVSAQLPVGRVGRAREVGEAIRFLMTSEFLTGTTLEVDGGHHLV